VFKKEITMSLKEKRVHLNQGDCREYLRELAPTSIDLIITDPP
jgi:predicted methyltransferase